MREQLAAEKPLAEQPSASTEVVQFWNLIDLAGGRSHKLSGLRQSLGASMARPESCQTLPYLCAR